MTQPYAAGPNPAQTCKVCHRCLGHRVRLELHEVGGAHI